MSVLVSPRQFLVRRLPAQMPSRDIKSGRAARVAHQMADSFRAPQRELAALAVRKAVDHGVDVCCVGHFNTPLETDQ
jgi:hypothetical protein